jgi:hypothetical protein
MMGFAALVESEPDFELTPAMSRALGPDYNPNMRFANAEENAPPTPLARIIGTFYRAVIGDEQFPRATTSVFFSDCAFIVYPTLENVFFAAQGLLNSLLMFHRIPVRIGIAYGTFIDARHSSIRTPLYSITTAQFFGTGVNRAHSAERTKENGFRAFVHPSIDIASAPNDFLKSHYVPLDAPTSTAAGEVSLLTNGFSDANRLGLSLASMKEAAPAGSRHHYDATFVAIRKMYNFSPPSGPRVTVRLIPKPLINVPEPPD